jgi:hypothetical protein
MDDNGRSLRRAFAARAAKSLDHQPTIRITNHHQAIMTPHAALLYATVYAGFFAVIGIAAYATQSAWPLVALLLLPSVKTNPTKP